MQSILSIVGGLVAALCAVLLIRGFFRSRQPLLFWSSLCFVGLATTNVLAYFDLAAGDPPSMYTLRLVVSAASLLLLVYGLVFRSE
jgi:hypothetical protein